MTAATKTETVMSTRPWKRNSAEISNRQRMIIKYKPRNLLLQTSQNPRPNKTISTRLSAAMRGLLRAILFPMSGVPIPSIFTEKKRAVRPCWNIFSAISPSMI